MTLSPSNTTVLRGSTVTLNCSTDANPDPHEFQLYFNDSYLGNSSSGLFNVSVDADGVYSCIPTNTVGTGHSESLIMSAVGELICFPYVFIAAHNYQHCTGCLEGQLAVAEELGRITVSQGVVHCQEVLDEIHSVYALLQCLVETMYTFLQVFWESKNRICQPTDYM